MDIDKLRSRMSPFWLLHISGWLAAAGLSAVYTYRGPWTDAHQLLLVFAPYVTGFLVCIPLRYFFKKIRLHERPLRFFILVALAATFVGANLWLALNAAAGLIILPLPQPPTPFVPFYLRNIINGGAFLLAWTSLYFGLKVRREWKAQEERTKRANALAQAAQLQMLRYQLNPHFLFNSMNSIRALIDEDEAKARELITELSDFLRYSLDSKDYADVPLRHEIEAIRHYFAIQKKRYEDRLEVTYDIEPQAGEYPVLSFLVHPLVENAVKYGMRTSSMPLAVHLEAKVRDGSLRIEVSNTGRWVGPEGQEGRIDSGTGTGLDNVRRRLENAFPNRHRFKMMEKDGRVHIQLEIGRPAATADETKF